MTSRDYFKGKRIAIIGLGNHGEMVEDLKFLIKAGAIVSLYDLKSEARIKHHLIFLRSIGLANYVCGSIPPDDLLDMDIIILSHEYPRESSFLKVARDKNIMIEYPETLFFKQAPPVTIVGVMGDCGKSTVMSMLYPMLKFACTAHESQGFFKIDPESDDGIISNLKKIKNGDLVLMRIVPLMMQEMARIRISPHVAVFTSVPGRASYGNVPFEILSYQTYNNFLIASDEVIDAARSFKELPRAKMLRTKSSLIPLDWEMKLSGPHDRDNAALALQAARLFKVEDDDARRILGANKPLKGHMEFVKKIKGIEVYNDSSSTNPYSTEIAIENISADKNIILIMGGAKTAYDYSRLYLALPKFVHTIILLPGSGTMHVRSHLEKINDVNVISVPTIEEAVRIAFDRAKKSDRILYSPGFEAGGADGSRKERGERFIRSIRAL